MKSLICINTCARPIAIKSMIWNYIDFIKDNEKYDFVVSLDGSDIQTIRYCKKYAIPLIYSEKNEGVGISKNRILFEYPDYDYYFFIEDDVELLNSDVFDIHIQISKKINLHHFSLFDRSRILLEKGKTKIDEYKVLHCMFGSAQVNFFTREGIQKVGGFHEMFAKYKRFGHTEHSYRFVNNSLSEYPFNIIENCIDGYFKWNDPRSVTQISVETSRNHLFIEEEKLIEEKLTFYPIKIISKYKKINTELDNDIKIDSYRKIYKNFFYLEMYLLTIVRKLKRYYRDLFK